MIELWIFSIKQNAALFCGLVTFPFKTLVLPSPRTGPLYNQMGSDSIAYRSIFGIRETKTGLHQVKES